MKRNTQKNTQKIFVLVLCLLILSTVVFTACKENKKVATAENSADFYYTCPMHPEIVRDEPGDCPICGMTLVKKTRGGSKRDEGSSVTVSPDLSQTFGVTT